MALLSPKGPRFRVINLIVDPSQGTTAIASAMAIPGYVFYRLERRGIRARLIFVREDLLRGKE